MKTLLVKSIFNTDFLIQNTKLFNNHCNDSSISDGTVLTHWKSSQTHKSIQGEYYDFPSQSDPIKM